MSKQKVKLSVPASGSPRVASKKAEGELEAARRSPRGSCEPLRQDIEQRLAEARREKEILPGFSRAGLLGAFYKGEIAALEWLLKRDDNRKKAARRAGNEKAEP